MSEETIQEKAVVTEPEEVVEEVAEETTPPESTEDRAKRMGWIEKERYSGRPDNWVDAEVFLKKADESLPILKERLKKLEARDIEREKGYKFLVNHAKEANQKGYDRAIKELTDKQSQAVEEADIERWKILEEEKSKLYEEKSKPIIEAPPQPQINKELQDWLTENTWYGDHNPSMKKYAEFVESNLVISDPAERLNAITAEVKREFPEKFGMTNGSIPRSSPVQGGKGAVDKGRGKRSFSSLPGTAKQVCKRFIQDGIIKNEKEYLDNYPWED